MPFGVYIPEKIAKKNVKHYVRPSGKTRKCIDTLLSPAKLCITSEYV